MTTNGSKAGRGFHSLWAVCIAVILLAAPGCSRSVSGVAVRDPSVPRSKPGDCEPVSAPLTSIDSRADGEPQLKIPQPPGWERVSMLDSDVIRFTARNDSLAADNFAPTAVVSLESIPVGVAGIGAIFGQERAALVERIGASGLQTLETARCGHQAEIVDYDAPGFGRIPRRRIRTLMVAAEFQGTTFVATVTVQSTEPDNAGYAHDTGAMLAGFQMVTPA